MYVHSRPFAANHPSAILNPNPMTPATATPTTDQAHLLRDLAAIVGEDAVLSGRSEMRVYDCDAYTVDKSAPAAVVLPQTTEQVAEIVRLCNRLRVPFVPRGA